MAFVRNKAVTAIDLAGYSFGAWINAGVAAAKRTAIESMMMVSPPVGFIEFENISALSSLNLVVTGSRDDIAPVDRIRDLLPTWNPHAQFEVIDGCDHFYSGYLEKLESILDRYLESAKSDPT
jgi:alpha/beta superfamily hydrolase